MSAAQSRVTGMGGHHSARAQKDEWLTPPEITQALGPFDLDPCSPINRPWATAQRHLTIEDDGLASQWLPWEFVWCNPPYGRETWKWLAKLADHPAGGIALIFARTETSGFCAEVWDKADAIFFFDQRLFFHHVDGTRASANCGAPSCLVAYGAEAVRRLSRYERAGSLVTRWRRAAA
ncbi:DNA N-6-adenine-methyltransferase [Nesterenkonia rhizosphaerae]|uniref:DNA N-6-adenine-methyltransferase n=1 Tax=Nesterenkonia rhizosphaerae TaxID=1348272 RepID=A0ABP9G1U0_9MICC